MCDTKKCTKCGKELPLDQFYKRSGCTRYQSSCKDCWRAASAMRYQKNKEKRREKDKINGAKWRKNNPEKHRENVLRWREDNPERYRENGAKWRKNNPEKVREKSARWARNNPEKRRVIEKRCRNKRIECDPGYMLKIRIRRAMSNVIGGDMKAGHTIELLGCSSEDLRIYIEGLFQPGMSWDNYGKYGWHLDHIIPLSYFDFTDSEQQKRAWHYTNLQPLWARDNIIKSNKIEERQLVLL